eukprot:s350_g5.t4
MSLRVPRPPAFIAVSDVTTLARRRRVAGSAGKAGMLGWYFEALFSIRWLLRPQEGRLVTFSFAPIEAAHYATAMRDWHPEPPMRCGASFGETLHALNFLDADPLWLFGVADPATQRALEKTAVVPMLRCMGQRPCIEEWFSYLNADEQGDAPFRWVVESFAEVELPEPWTSFKGVGSVVCYLNNETNETTWKHPFYDYFAQLLNHCRRSTNEEHIKLRINRVLWSYEAESQTDVQAQMPLVSPKYVKILGEILDCELVSEPFMVRTLKTFLKAFSQMYHDGELDTQEVMYCLDIVKNERAKAAVAKQLGVDPATDLDAGDIVGQGQMKQHDSGLLHIYVFGQALVGHRHTLRISENEGLSRGVLIGDDIFLSWGGFAALAAVLLAGGIWRIRRRRRIVPREPQVLGRLLDEVEEQELVPATANGYGTS